MMARSERAVDRLLAAMGIRRIPLEEALERLQEAIGTAGTITISIHDETRKPRMDFQSLIARWRRMSGHLRGLRSGAGGLTPADVYELCADELEARVRTHELMQQARKEAEQA